LFRKVHITNWHQSSGNKAGGRGELSDISFFMIHFWDILSFLNVGGEKQGRKEGDKKEFKASIRRRRNMSGLLEGFWETHGRVLTESLDVKLSRLSDHQMDFINFQNGNADSDHRQQHDLFRHVF
jgi:hypothetical protein